MVIPPEFFDLTRFAVFETVEDQGKVFIHVAVAHLANVELEPLEDQLEQAAEDDCHEQGAEPDRAPQEVADDQHADLDQIADQADGHAGALGEGDHHAVARAGAELCAQVDVGGQRHDDGADQHLAITRPGVFKDGHPAAAVDQIDEEADKDDIADGAPAEPFTEDDIQDDDGDTHELRGGADGDAELEGEPLVEDAPRRQAFVGVKSQDDAQAVESVAGHEMHDLFGDGGGQRG